MLVLSNSVTFSGKTIGPEEFLIQMIEALGIMNKTRGRFISLI
jgi:hypothetical protein